MSAQDFTEEQRRYLEGFAAGVQARRAAQGLKPLGGSGGPAAPSGPDKDHLAAMARFEAAGKKLSAEEKAKRDEHPFDAYARFKSDSAKGQFPKGFDNFRWRFHGLFYVAPTQSSYMCRLRIPNGILSHWQFAGVADLAERYGGGYAHLTTRANLQIREVMPDGAVPLIEGLASLGISTKGSGADNIRNVTGSPTAGIDPQELIDTRPFASAWHYHILNDRSLYGLPRKFNVGFDGGGAIPVLEDTNDIAFTAVTAADPWLQAGRRHRRGRPCPSRPGDHRWIARQFSRTSSPLSARSCRRSSAGWSRPALCRSSTGGSSRSFALRTDHEVVCWPTRDQGPALSGTQATRGGLWATR